MSDDVKNQNNAPLAVEFQLGAMPDGIAECGCCDNEGNCLCCNGTGVCIDIEGNEGSCLTCNGRGNSN